MERIKENLNYQNIILCNHCGAKILYHVTDIKGVAGDKYIHCPECMTKIYLKREIYSSNG